MTASYTYKYSNDAVSELLFVNLCLSRFDDFEQYTNHISQFIFFAAVADATTIKFHLKQNWEIFTFSHILFHFIYLLFPLQSFVVATGYKNTKKKTSHKIDWLGTHYDFIFGKCADLDGFTLKFDDDYVVSISGNRRKNIIISSILFMFAMTRLSIFSLAENQKAQLLNQFMFEIRFSLSLPWNQLKMLCLN